MQKIQSESSGSKRMIWFAALCAFAVATICGCQETSTTADAESRNQSDQPHAEDLRQPDELLRSTDKTLRNPVKPNQDEATQDEDIQDEETSNKETQNKETQDEETQDEETPDEEASLDDYSEDGFFNDPLVKDSKLPKIEDHWIRISETDEIWFDPRKKQVIVGGRICLRRGPLEMFACPQYLKEHESVIAVHSSAVNVHAALLRVGAEPGSPVRYEPDYIPVSGSKVKIDVTWLVDGKPKTIDAQLLIRNMATKKPLDTDWVFGGSISGEDPNSGRMLYGGDDGMLICVSNFTIATLDIPVESTDLEGNWMFEACTENIPQRGTRVLLTLKPEIESAKSEEELDQEIRDLLGGDKQRSDGDKSSQDKHDK